MLTINFIKDNAKAVKLNIKNRRVDVTKADVDRLLKLDIDRIKTQTDTDNLRAERNKLTNELKTIREPKLMEQSKKIKEQIVELEKSLKIIRDEWQSIMDWIPNMCLDDVPVGKDDTENMEIKVWTPKNGYIKELNSSSEKMGRFGTNSDKEFIPRPHWEIGKELDLMDLEAGAKVSGSRFYYLKGNGFMMMYGVFDLLMKKIIKDGFIPMDIPVLVKERALYGSSQFPADADQVYKIESKYVENENQLYLVGSSEPSLFSYYLDTVIDPKDLPIKITATCPCFRSEAGSWGKDIRGMKRVHQFTKLEMDMIIKPDIKLAKETHEYLLGINEWLLQQLELPYHVINMCTGDLGYAAAAKKYDVEVWLPSESAWMETMSDSITTDFQTRRLNIKTLNEKSEKVFAYTINDTGATHRLLIAIIEHYQQSDGSLVVPTILREYLGMERISKK